MNIEHIERLHTHMKTMLDAEEKLLVFIMVMSLATGAAFGMLLAWSEAKTNAVKQSCGYYDSRTGEFKWGQP